MTDKAYPSGNAISFLICETVRQESHGKAALLGVYVGGEMVVSNDAPADVVLPIALYWSFDDGAGEFRWSARIISPTGEQVMSHPGDVMTKPENTNMTFAIIAPFKPAGEGRYTVEVSLDQRKYTRTFGYKRGPLPAV